jgi:ABC-type Fe3+-hydroxamate transport system substrate-binding protein
MAAAPRIASLVPSLTELVVALGLGEHLVARTGFCVHPAQALRTVPKVGGTKDVNLAKLVRLAPTHVLVNVDENRHETVQAMQAWPVAPHVIVTHPCDPHDNLALIEQLRAAFRAVPGVDRRADALLHELRAELEVTQSERFAPQRVLYLIWRAPWMTVARDTYLSRMLARVNWQTWPEQAGGPAGAARYPQLRGDEPWLHQIDRVLLSSEPYAFAAKHFGEAQRLSPNARVSRVDGELLGWYGPRAVPGLRYLRQLATPVVATPR